jgi:single-stranded DNA-binding protein
MSTIHLVGRLVKAPAISTTQKGGSMVKILLETESVRQTKQGPISESQILPITAFGWAADSIAELSAGDKVMLSCRLQATEYRPPGGEIRRGVQIVAEIVAVPVARRKAVEAEIAAR